MSKLRTTRLIASGAVSAALAVSVLTLAPSSPASAATATGEATYTCTSASPVTSLVAPLLASLPAPLNQLATTGFTVPANITLSNLPDVLTANVPVPAGTGITEVLQLPTNGSGLTGALTSVSSAVNSLLGTTPLSAVSTNLSNGVATINGQLGSFDPSAGLPLPSDFGLNLGLLVGNGNPLLSTLGVNCTYNPGSLVVPSATGGGAGGGGSNSFGGLPVSKQKAKIKAHQVGKKSTVVVKVKNQTGKASGKVVAKLNGKKVAKGTLKNGKTRLNLKRLKRGLNKVKLVYKGDAVSLSAKKKVRVTLVRR